MIGNPGGKYGPALLTACAKGIAKLVKALLQNGADPNVKGTL
jgi:hypothetical protein